ncbi:MAG: hypothetical protein C4B59_02815 [Candidatus Methanogaster sp.]|uniref:Uncharacterized protein n=1 Tax=Candidatus Methanogaster sp. TaxID=3386292 RepID=A0AC61L5Z0_9EURY|nr:MAG: hypothetical protein C4B59_02815 [ANME-2 cluster archaeon]
MEVSGVFGLHDVPLRMDQEGISLSVKRMTGGVLYKRECMDEEVEKSLLSSNNKILINPVEPVNKPKELTPHFLIEFERSIFIEPSAKKAVFVKFPVEIGVFVHGKKNFQILDVLTLNKQKFTLYGSLTSGVICKYWKSEVYSTIPDTNPVYEGVIELNITNTTARWVELTKAVFSAYGMKIYYSDDMVAMRANMRIVSKKVAEIDFVNSPLGKGMKRSLELYTSRLRKIPVIATKFLMDEGI